MEIRKGRVALIPDTVPVFHSLAIAPRRALLLGVVLVEEEGQLAVNERLESRRSKVESSYVLAQRRTTHRSNPLFQCN